MAFANLVVSRESLRQETLLRLHNVSDGYARRGGDSMPT